SSTCRFTSSSDASRRTQARCWSRVRNLLHSSFAMNVGLSARGPLDVGAPLSRYRRWGEDPVNRLEDGRFRRALQVDGRWHGYDLTWADDTDRAQLTIAVPGTRSRRVVDAA